MLWYRSGYTALFLRGKTRSRAISTIYFLFVYLLLVSCVVRSLTSDYTTLFRFAFANVTSYMRRVMEKNARDRRLLGQCDSGHRIRGDTHQSSVRHRHGNRCCIRTWRTQPDSGTWRSGSSCACALRIHQYLQFKNKKSNGLLRSWHISHSITEICLI